MNVTFVLLLAALVTAAAIQDPPPWNPNRPDGTFSNPVLHADYSDPDVVRVGPDYYMTSSSFSAVPGLPILHSKDLVNWSLVNHALPRLVPEDVFRVPRHGAGVWAPAIRHRAGKYWIYYPDPDFGIYAITAADPRGAWSKPMLVKQGKGLIDPCPLWDDDGRVYLVHAFARSRAGFANVLHLNRMNEEAMRVVDEGRVVIDGDRIPGYTTLEGPKFYKRNGWYYIFAPAGGVKQGWRRRTDESCTCSRYAGRMIGPWSATMTTATGAANRGDRGRGRRCRLRTPRFHHRPTSFAGASACNGNGRRIRRMAGPIRPRQAVSGCEPCPSQPTCGRCPICCCRSSPRRSSPRTWF